jgi:hypothetical protein
MHTLRCSQYFYQQMQLSESVDSYADLHNWMLRMLEDGFLWRRFIE